MLLESSYVKELLLWPESSYKSPNCTHKSNSPNSGHAIYYVLVGRIPPLGLSSKLYDQS